MQEAQTQSQETTAAEKKKRQTKPRPYRFFVAVKHRQIDAETNRPADPEFLEFPDKAALREALGQAKYEGAEIRVIRGYEMAAKAKRHISLN